MFIFDLLLQSGWLWKRLFFARTNTSGDVDVGFGLVVDEEVSNEGVWLFEVVVAGVVLGADADA